MNEHTHRYKYIHKHIGLFCLLLTQPQTLNFQRACPNMKVGAIQTLKIPK